MYLLDNGSFFSQGSLMFPIPFQTDWTDHPIVHSNVLSLERRGKSKSVSELPVVLTLLQPNAHLFFPRDG
jgi:hypothetical protein